MSPPPARSGRKWTPSIPLSCVSRTSPRSSRSRRTSPRSRVPPDSSPERVSQAVRGARVTILSESGDYALVSTEDRYQGWIAKARLVPAWDDSDYFKMTVTELIVDVTTHPNPFFDVITKL